MTCQMEGWSEHTLLVNPKYDGSLGGVTRRNRFRRPDSYLCYGRTSEQCSVSVEELPNGNAFTFDLLLNYTARTVLWVINRNENLTHYIIESNVSISRPKIRAV